MCSRSRGARAKGTRPPGSKANKGSRVAHGRRPGRANEYERLGRVFANQECRLSPSSLWRF